MYQELIREHAARIGRIGVDPRHVEAWMRVEHGTLDALSPAQFATEVETGIACMDASPAETNERLAESLGL